MLSWRFCFFRQLKINSTGGVFEKVSCCRLCEERQRRGNPEVLDFYIEQRLPGYARNSGSWIFQRP